MIPSCSPLFWEGNLFGVPSPITPPWAESVRVGPVNALCAPPFSSHDPKGTQDSQWPGWFALQVTSLVARIDSLE